MCPTRAPQSRPTSHINAAADSINFLAHPPSLSSTAPEPLASHGSERAVVCEPMPGDSPFVDDLGDLKSSLDRTDFVVAVTAASDAIVVAAASDELVVTALGAPVAAAASDGLVVAASDGLVVAALDGRAASGDL